LDLGRAVWIKLGCMCIVVWTVDLNMHGGDWVWRIVGVSVIHTVRWKCDGHD
jgi:hypothetical protein